MGMLCWSCHTATPEWAAQWAKTAALMDRLQGGRNGPVTMRLCAQGSTAAMVSKRGAGTPKSGAMDRENGLALFLHRFQADLASIS